MWFNTSRSSTIPQCLDVKEFEKQLIATKGEQLIDICTPQEFEKSHIPGAKNIDVNSSDFRIAIKELDKTKPVLIYCKAGGRCKSALTVFKEEGFKNVHDLSDGINAWSKAGKKIWEINGNVSEKELLEILNLKQ
jgi:rhodanese-related sulfurtransferase